jgi:hypothetical protein
MIRCLDLPTGERLRVCDGWDAWTYQGQRYRLIFHWLYVWSEEGWRSVGIKSDTWPENGV